MVGNQVLGLFGVVLLGGWLASESALGEPPFGGTIFIDPNIITEADPTAFVEIEATGRGTRTMYDRRVNDWIQNRAYLFEASYDDGLTIEMQVNAEFGSESAAHEQAEKYAIIFGRLPTLLRLDVETSWIHRGVNPFGGGNRNLLIHTGQSDLYVRDGILEETLVHEASHTSLDADHANSAGWRAAQEADDEFISTYARDFPRREDIAESFLTYLAVRHLADRIPESLAKEIREAIPNRIAYFDSLELDLYPLIPRPPLEITKLHWDRSSGNLEVTWNSIPNAKYFIELSSDLVNWRQRPFGLTARDAETTRTIRIGTDDSLFVRILAP